MTLKKLQPRNKQTTKTILKAKIDSHKITLKCKKFPG